MFTSKIRNQVLEIMSRRNVIEFVEVEYRPPLNDQRTAIESPKQRIKRPKSALRKRPATIMRLRRHETGDVKLVGFLRRETRNFLRKAPGMESARRVSEKDETIETVPRIDAVNFV